MLQVVFYNGWMSQDICSMLFDKTLLVICYQNFFFFLKRKFLTGLKQLYFKQIHHLFFFYFW